MVLRLKYFSRFPRDFLNKFKTIDNKWPRHIGFLLLRFDLHFKYLHGKKTWQTPCQITELYSTTQNHCSLRWIIIVAFSIRSKLPFILLLEYFQPSTTAKVIQIMICVVFILLFNYLIKVLTNLHILEIQHQSHLNIYL